MATRKPPEPLFAAMAVVEFPAQALAFVHPELKRTPFVVIEQNEAQHKTRVTAVSPEAYALGVWPGMSLYTMRRRCSQVTSLARDLKAESVVRNMLSDWLGELTPVFEVQPRRILADITGTPLARHFTLARSPSSRLASGNPVEFGVVALAHHLHREALNRGLMQVTVGVGGTSLMAQILARQMQPNGAQACVSGMEAAMLAPLPPDCLPGLSSSTRDLLRKLQLTRLDSIAALGCSELMARFGTEGEALHRMACGLDLEVTPKIRHDLQVETVLPVDDCDDESLRQAMRLTVDKLVFALQEAGSAADRIRIALIYSDGREVSRTLNLARATASFPTLTPPVLAVFATLHQRRVALSRLRLRVPTPREESGQTDLFDDAVSLRRQALGEAIAHIRHKRTFGAIVNAANIKKIR
jgi:protein ImuB